MKSNAIKSGTVCGALLLATALPLFAAEDALEEIVVTAQRRVENKAISTCEGCHLAPRAIRGPDRFPTSLCIWMTNRSPFHGGRPAEVRCADSTTTALVSDPIA